MDKRCSHVFILFQHPLIKSDQMKNSSLCWGTKQKMNKREPPNISTILTSFLFVHSHIQYYKWKDTVINKAFI